MIEKNYDLVAIGSDPAGQKGAINAVKMGKRVALGPGSLELQAD